MAKLIDLTGQKFGRLTVVSRAENNKRGNAMWNCKCDCGNEVAVLGTSLRIGDTKSCGCYRNEVLKNHGRKHNFKTENYRQKSGINHNRTENWKEDTMLCSLQNRKRMKNNKTGINGVSWCNTYQKYVANIRFQKRLIFLGRFNTLEEAAQARGKAEEKYFNPILEKYGRLENE